MLTESFAVRLKKALEYKGMKQIELADKTNIDKSLISNYLKGKYEAKQNNIYLMAQALDVSEAWLMGYDVPRERVKDTTNERYLEFYATDDSMAPLLNINDIAYVNEQSTYKDNDTILFEYNGLLQIRKVNIKDGYIELRAMNPYFPLIVIKNEELSKMRVIGKVIKAENQSAFK